MSVTAHSLYVMIIRSQGAVLRSVCLRLELWPILCQCRSKSTKSAIHAALKNSQPQYEVTGSRPSKAPRGRAPARDATRIKQRGLPEERFVGRAAQANQDFQKLLRSSHSGSHQPRSDRLRESSFSNDSDHLSHRNGRQSISPAENSHRLRGSMHHRRDDDETFELDRTTSPSPRSSRAHAASSLHNFLPKEEAFDVAEHSIPEPRAERLEPGRRTKKDFVGNNRYDIDGKISQLEFEDTEPTRLPYTTPASEFLYGHSVVMAALRSRRRKLYKMYIYQGPKREDEKRDMDMRKMALDLDVPVERVPATGLRMLDQVSEGRPHNVSAQSTWMSVILHHHSRINGPQGFVLEASPLPRLPIRGFDRVTWPGEHFLAFLDHQSREDEEINGTDPRIKCESVFPRFPFVLLLDGVVSFTNGTKKAPAYLVIARSPKPGGNTAIRFFPWCRCYHSRNPQNGTAVYSGIKSICGSFRRYAYPHSQSSPALLRRV